MAEILVEIRDVSKRFDDNFELRDVSLELRAGEVHIITGENGSGKSTLMKLLSGFHEPDSGTISVDGKVLELGSVSEARKHGIIYQAQDIELFDNLSIAENVFFNRLHRGLALSMTPVQLRQRCQFLFDKLEIPLDAGGMVSSLGYAEKLLVVACATYASKGKVIVFDEPTAGMGDRERVTFFKILKNLQKRRAGIFYVTHRLDEIPAIGTKVTVMQQGKVTGQRASVGADRATIIRMMIGENFPERYPRLDTKPGANLLEVKRLSSSPVLSDVSFSLRQSEILGISGLMGSGRSRLANCLFGLIRPDGGEIRIGSKTVNFKHPADALEHGVALIPEDRSKNAIFSRQNALSNLVYAALSRFNTSRGLNINYMEELGQEYFESFGIVPAELRDQIHVFSGGNQQKIVIARWLMSLANIYIMDEPTRGIDAAARVDIYNAMNDVVAKGAAIILISSDTEELLGMCDRILVLSKGRIAGELPRKSATKEQILEFASEG